jgi:hypothetical protein
MQRVTYLTLSRKKNQSLSSLSPRRKLNKCSKSPGRSWKTHQGCWSWTLWPAWASVTRLMIREIWSDGVLLESLLESLNGGVNGESVKLSGGVIVTGRCDMAQRRLERLAVAISKCASATAAASSVKAVEYIPRDHRGCVTCDFSDSGQTEMWLC